VIRTFVVSFFVGLLVLVGASGVWHAIHRSPSCVDRGDPAWARWSERDQDCVFAESPD
jgi:hypothetical protein